MARQLGQDAGIAAPSSRSSPLASQEFENPEGEDCSGEYTPPAEETSSSQSLPDVYILPLAEVSLPMPAPQPAHSGTPPPQDRSCDLNTVGFLSWLREGRGQNAEPWVHGINL